MEPEHLKLERICKRYPGPADAGHVSVLEDITLDVRLGETLAIVGPSGSGKSTLLHIAGALERPTSGTVTFEGKSLGDMSDLDLAQLRNQSFGFIFQSHYLLPQCTVLENTLVPTLAAPKRAGGSGQSTEAPEARARRLLDRVGLGHRLNHRPSQLSGGERQRAAVVRALINCPHVLLADEPTGSLDPVSAEALATLLVELNREEKVTLIVVTHAFNLAARMGRVLELRTGRLTARAAEAPMKPAPASAQAKS